MRSLCEESLRFDCQRNLRPSRDDHRAHRALWLHQDVAAAANALRRLGRALLCGQVLPAEYQAGGAIPALERRGPRHNGLNGIARAPNVHVRNDPQRREVLDRLMRGSVLTESNRVVCEHEYRADPHERRHAQRAAAIVGEGEERAAVGNECTVQCESIHDRCHSELTHPVVQIVARRAGADRPRATPEREVRPGEIR